MASLTRLGIQFNYLLHYININNLNSITHVWLDVPKMFVLFFLMAYLVSVILATCLLTIRFLLSPHICMGWMSASQCPSIMKNDLYILHGLTCFVVDSTVLDMIMFAYVFSISTSLDIMSYS